MKEGELRTLLVGLLMALSPIAMAEMVQPPYENSDPAVSENFRKVYYDVDEINRQLSAGTSEQILVSDGQGSFLWGVSSTTLMTVSSSAATNLQNSSATVTYAQLSSMTVNNVHLYGNEVISGTKTFSGIIKLADGGATAPSYTFTTDNQTGFYLPAAGHIVVTNNGTPTIGIYDDLTQFNYPIRAADGSVSAPSISFVNSSGSGIYKVGTNNIGIVTGGAKAIDVSAAGIITQPLQPSFLLDTCSATDQTGNGTEYYPVAFDQERWDLGSNVANNTFTAPVDGKYLFAAGVELSGMLTSHTTVVLRIWTSNHIFWFQRDNSLNTDGFGMNGSVIGDMDANDTAFLTVTVYNGTKVVDFTNNYASNFFSGSLIN